ncbi:MAG: ATP-binding cassette domain-containing protein [Sphingobacteriia bacterium]|nr:MAG: ATP-binding cassette domain-containing protein [Sphingobacteriia bacterium]
MFELNQVMPFPLKEKKREKGSEIWNKHVQFKSGERIKITAPSGTGKTTLIHQLYGLRNDYDGVIQFNGKDIKQFNADQVAIQRQLSISIIFQDLQLFEQLTARENIELKRILQTPFYESSKIEEMAQLLGIRGILDQSASTCSYGEQQRICIIRALIQPFDWLLMDEPFSHLDLENQHLAIQLINEECNKRNAGFVLTDLNDDQSFIYSRTLYL